MVGSLNLDQGCKGLGPEIASPATPGRLTTLFKFGDACATISCVASTAVWEVLSGEHCGVPEAWPWSQLRKPGPRLLSGPRRGSSRTLALCAWTTTPD